MHPGVCLGRRERDQFAVLDDGSLLYIALAEQCRACCWHDFNFVCGAGWLRLCRLPKCRGQVAPQRVVPVIEVAEEIAACISRAALFQASCACCCESLISFFRDCLKCTNPVAVATAKNCVFHIMQLIRLERIDPGDKLSGVIGWLPLIRG